LNSISFSNISFFGFGGAGLAVMTSVFVFDSAISFGNSISFAVEDASSSRLLFSAVEGFSFFCTGAF
jgi:hypothetical protein